MSGNEKDDKEKTPAQQRAEADAQYRAMKNDRKHRNAAKYAGHSYRRRTRERRRRDG